METAVPILAMVSSHPEVMPYHQQMIANVQPQLEAEMGVELFAKAWERGREMDFETAVAQMRSVLSNLEMPT